MKKVKKNNKNKQHFVQQTFSLYSEKTHVSISSSWAGFEVFNGSLDSFKSYQKNHGNLC